MPGELSTTERKGLKALVRQYPQVHLGIGLVGNTVFVVGSVLFMTKHQDAGMYFFLSGSIGMLLGQLGELLRNMGWRRLRTHDVDPWASEPR